MSHVYYPDTDRRANKKHTCYLCRRHIEIGEKYVVREGVEDGEFWRMKMHPECRQFADSTFSPRDWEGLCSWAGGEFIEEMGQWYADKKQTAHNASDTEEDTDKALEIARREVR